MRVHRGGQNVYHIGFEGTLTVRQQAVVAATWAPTDITGCVVWLDADQITGLNDADEVLLWEDMASTNDAAGVTTAVPLYKVNIQNSLPVVRFDGTGDILTITGLGTGAFNGKTAGTGFFVFSPTNDTQYAVMGFSSSGGNVGFWRYANDTNGYMALFRANRLNALPLAQPTSGWHIHTVRSGPTDGYNYFREGSLDVDVAADWGVPANAVLGLEYSDTDFKGDMGEIIMYNVELSDANVAIVEAYLSAKWNIALP
jgi:hypothetical protein